MHDTLHRQFHVKSDSKKPFFFLSVFCLLLEHREEIIFANIEPCRLNSLYDIQCQIYHNFLEFTVFNGNISGTPSDRKLNEGLF
jgi:hypothetical protein